MPFGLDIVQALGWALVVIAAAIFGAGYALGRWTAPRR